LAMYAAKYAGRNQIRIYSPDLSLLDNIISINDRVFNE
jgi:hypothetical protein